MSDKQVWGLLAEFETAPGIFNACEKVRDAGYSKWDAHTPFPVHGLERAMGLPASHLPWIILFCALSGMVGAFALEGWVSAVAYPLVISGKELLSWEAFVPIAFEVTVLLGAFGAVFGMLALNGLPRLHHPLFDNQRFERATDDRFFISIEASDPKFDMAATKALLTEAGATVIEQVED